MVVVVGVLVVAVTESKMNTTRSEGKQQINIWNEAVILH